jgi:hypothetical protein
VVGEGAAAAIEVDISRVDALLHGPNFDPPARIDSARIRYRWVGRGTNELVFLTMYLRPPTLTGDLTIPKLFPDFSQDFLAGTWVETVLTDHNVNRTRGPYDTLFPTIQLTGSGTYGPARIRGVIQIDWIALTRH